MLEYDISVSILTVTEVLEMDVTVEMKLNIEFW